jgi:diguanylate cyclase (GGDEF)-like protein
MNLSYEELSQTALRLDPLPEVMKKLLVASLGRSGSLKEETWQLVQLDMALCLNLLYLGNSRSFGVPGRVGSLQQIRDALEPEMIRDCMLSQVSHIGLNENPSEIILNDQRAFFKHSLGCARYAEAVARAVGFPEPEMAYLAGLIHDFSKITLYQCYPDQYQRIFQMMEREDLQLYEAEVHFFQSHHAAIAGQILNSWNVPDNLRVGISMHHSPEVFGSAEGAEFMLPRIIQAGDYFAYQQHEGDAGNAQKMLKEVPPQSKVMLADSLSREQVQQIRQSLEQEYIQIEIGILEPKEYVNLVAEANRYLGRRSVQLQANLRDISLIHQVHQVFDISESLEEILINLSRILIGTLHAVAVGFLLDKGEGQRCVYLGSDYELPDEVHFYVREELRQAFAMQIEMEIESGLLNQKTLPLGSASSFPPPEESVWIGSSSVFRLDGQRGALGTLGVFSKQSHVFTQEEYERFLVVAELIAMGLDRYFLDREARQLSMTDGLTGLYNHRQFKMFLDKELTGSLRYGYPVSLIILDIDHFKYFNDRFGHLVGDDVLRELAELLRQLTRESDIVARYGGEEFAVLSSRTSLNDSKKLADRIQKAVGENNFCSETGKTLKITVSQGIACYPSEGIHTGIDLIEASDKALYVAKNSGRNQVQIAPNKPIDR